MQITIASTYPPRACGLATFAQDLRGGLSVGNHAVDVVAVVTAECGERLPAVSYEILQPDRAAYAAAAEHVNASGAEVVSLQHEFGIFGGDEGSYVLDFLRDVTVPVVTTLHTVLPSPPDHYRRALVDVAALSDRLVVMTKGSRDLLTSVYGVPERKIAVIPHGAPSWAPRAPQDVRPALGVEGRTVLLTFGLLGPSKGVEFALESLQGAVEACPDLLYVVLGSTHPEIVKREGEAYRESLQAEVDALGLADHVRFVDQYVDNAALWDWLSAADVYVTPYPGMDQACSGTLAYALAAGLPVVSTPYLHAREVLADGAGALVPYGDVEAFGAALARFASDPAARAEAGRQARDFGRNTAWPLTGEAYATVFEQALGERRHRPASASPTDLPLPVHPAALPAAIEYLVELTDDTGPFQHATFGVPDRDHGYCTDDAARVLVAAYAAARRLDPASPLRQRILTTARTCLSFVHHAQRPDGSFENMMDYGRRFTEQGTEDTVGRAMWGLGATVAWAPDDASRRLARGALDRALAVDLSHPRALAYALCGLALALDAEPGNGADRERVVSFARRLVEAFDRTVSPRWRWFCDALTYANAIVPYALHRAAAYAEGDDARRFREVAEDTAEFVLSHTVRDGRFDAVGNRGWLTKSGDRAPFDQQPIDPGYSAWFWAQMADSPTDRLADAARLAVAWFFGHNRVGQSLFDERTGACFDGFSPDGVNLNQGAESAIASVLALLAADDLGCVAETADEDRRAIASA